MKKLQEEYSSEQFLSNNKHLSDDIIELRKLISKGNQTKIKNKIFAISNKIKPNTMSQIITNNLESQLNNLDFTPRKLFLDMKGNSLIIIR